MKNVLLAIAFALVIGCATTATQSPDPVPVAMGKKGCVQVYYDHLKNDTYPGTRSYARMLVNLLGHFPEYRVILSPLEQYHQGDLERCHASIYLGVTAGVVQPPEFLQDFATTKK